MGLLARASRTSSRSKDTQPAGYIKEFLTLVLKPLLPAILDRNITVITNAGGLDPLGLKHLIESHAASIGESARVRVAAVSGDDLTPAKDSLLLSGALTPFDPLNGTGTPEASLTETSRPLSVNAYLGAEPIAKALAAGANIVVTGRCVDSASVLGPLAFEYGWDFSRIGDQSTLDKLASASLAGHILECGAQATGGNFTDWEMSARSPHGGWANMGYPIAAFDGGEGFTITKPRGTGGLVTRHTVGEQMMYEVLDPENYILPDVVLDLSRVTLEQVGCDVVRVAGARGKPPTAWLKCTAVHQTAYRVAADLVVFGVDADKKGQALGEAILARAERIAAAELEDGGDWGKLESKIIIIGAEHSLPASTAVGHSREVVVRVTAKHPRPDVLAILSREVAPFATSSAPGLGMLSGGRAKVSPGFKSTSVLVRREAVSPAVQVGHAEPFPVPLAIKGCKDVVPSSSATTAQTGGTSPRKTHDGATVRLIEVAVGRSGDKGDSANVGIIARTPELYPVILAQVTPEAMREALGHHLQPDSTVTRYEVPGIYAVNFVLTKALGGGGLDSLALDRYVHSSMTDQSLT